MPSQTIKKTFALKNPSYQKVITDQGQLTLELLITYTDGKDKPGKYYYSRSEFEFIPSQIPLSWDYKTPLEMKGKWGVVSADMK